MQIIKNSVSGIKFRFYTVFTLLRDKLSLFVNKKNFEWIISIFGTLLVVVFLWAPFGLKNPDIADGWWGFTLASRYTITDLFSRIFTGTVERPLVYFPWKFASMLSKDSYVGVGFIFALSFWGKAVVLYAILRKMRLASPSLSLFIAILFILYPADQGNFLMSALSRHVAVLFYLASVLLMVLASQHFNPIYVVGMLLAEAISALISEQGFPLIFLTPMLLLADNGCSPRKKKIISALWYAIFLLSVFNFLIAPKEYQGKVFRDGFAADSLTYISEIVSSNLVAYKRIFFDGWVIALNGLQNIPANLILFAFGITLTVMGGIYLLEHWTADDENTYVHSNTQKYFCALLIGLAVVGLGFFPYSITKYRYYDFRVFYYSAAGGALVVGLIYLLINDRIFYSKKPAIFILWGVTIFLASVNGLVQLAGYTAQSTIQQNVLIGIVEQVPNIKQGTVIVLVIPPAYYSDFTMAEFTGKPFRHHFGKALAWIYKINILGIQCDPRQLDLCNIPYERAILFNYTEDQKVVLMEEIPVEYQQEGITDKYKPYARIASYVPFPERPQNAFDIKPALVNVAPLQWVSENQTLNDRRVCDSAYSGNCSLLFYDDGTATIFSQEMNAIGDADEHFELSLWGRSERIIEEAVSMATLVVFYEDGTQEEYDVSGQLSNEWTLQQLDFKMNKPYSRLLLRLYPYSVSALIWLDDIHLVRNSSEVLILNSSFEE